MKITPQAIEAAAKGSYEWAYDGAAWERATSLAHDAFRNSATAALEAALPHLEAALRKQIANELRDAQGRAPGLLAHDAKRAGYISGMAHAARIAEEGTTR